MGMGKVWLIGAGPGDIGLFTIKGQEVLQKAEVVVYDSLVGQGVLSKIPASAKRIFVGKRASHHTMPQEEINTGEYVKDAMCCSMCKRMVINAGIERVIVRDDKDRYRVIGVNQWVADDESLKGVLGY